MSVETGRIVSGHARIAVGERLARGLALPRTRRARLALTVASLAVVTLLLAILLVAPAPVAGGGDYGQWLMVARSYRGLEVPEYRNIAGLPPLIPAAIAAAWTLLGTPFAALRAVDLLLLTGLVAALAAVARALFRHPFATLGAPIVGLFVADRFGELFAFGGLLQLGGLCASTGAIAALIAAEERNDGGRAWPLRIAAALLLALAGLSHVGTTETMLPIWAGLAGVLALRRAWRRAEPWHELARMLLAHVPTLVILAPVGALWIVRILPANKAYFANPATAAYRAVGPFLAGLVSYRPDAVIIGLGALALGVGLVIELRRERRFGPWATLGTWMALAWCELGGVVALGVSTDYPRFGTVLLLPFVVAVAGGIAGTARALGAWRGLRMQPLVAAVCIAALVAILPLSIGRTGQLARFYAAPSSDGLVEAISVLDASIEGREGTILTGVRAGKLLEGLTGRESLFSQPVRFAFRPAEWQRSLDAEVLMNAAAAITSESFLAEYRRPVEAEGFRSAADLVLAANHDGEWVKLFVSLARDTFVVDSAGVKHGGASFVPSGNATQMADPWASVMESEWVDPKGFAMQRTVSLQGGSETARVTVRADGRVTMRLYPGGGLHFTTLKAKGSNATVCFTQQGRREPCVELSVAAADGSIDLIGDGGLWVRGGAAGGLDLAIRDLTAGDPIVGLESLDPLTLAPSRGVDGAIVETTAARYGELRTRLERIGFSLVGTYGDRYAVYVRRDAG